MRGVDGAPGVRLRRPGRDGLVAARRLSRM